MATARQTALCGFFLIWTQFIGLRSDLSGDARIVAIHSHDCYSNSELRNSDAGRFFAEPCGGWRAEQSKNSAEFYACSAKSPAKTEFCNSEIVKIRILTWATRHVAPATANIYPNSGELLRKMPLFSFSKKRKVLFVASEAAPFAKAGGLGEVMYALPSALLSLGVDVRLMIPKHSGNNTTRFLPRPIVEGLRVATGSDGTKDDEPKQLICNVWQYVPQDDEKDSCVETYFLENAEYFEKRSNIYGYTDDVIRWNLLCKGTLEFLLKHDWMPDVIVCADWQCGFLPNYLATTYKAYPQLKRIATVFAIHNLYFQGMFDHRFVNEMDADDGQSPLPPFFNPRLGKINAMRRGILYADEIVTVSPNYAKEIMTKEYGEGLTDLLLERRFRVHGILNGINYADYDPATDPNVKQNYSLKHIAARRENKRELQKRFGLKEDLDAPIIAIVSRLVEQKGFDLLLPVADSLLQELGFQLVVVGSGDSKFMGFFKELAGRFPGQVSTHLQFDSVLPRLVYAGADMILVPSKYEPCGLTQMEALRYGAIPIVRKTGGLIDSVVNYDPKTRKGTGFVFEKYDPFSLAVVITRACENYGNKEVWQLIERQAMSADFSWSKSASGYASLFEEAIRYHEQEIKDSSPDAIRMT